jgi:hypothetical protein
MELGLDKFWVHEIGLTWPAKNAFAQKMFQTEFQMELGLEHFLKF